MSKPLIAVFSGPTSTIANSPPLVTSNKARLEGERMLPGRFDHLVPQFLYEPVTVKIRKFSAHPLEADSAEVYQDNGKDYYEAVLKPEDGPYPLPYMARRKNGSPKGRPFEAGDLLDPTINFGGRQGFYPDASRIFLDIDRTVSGRSEGGKGSTLDRKADYEFIRALPPAGYASKREVSGIDYFPYEPYPIGKNVRCKDLARVTNTVQKALSSGRYSGGIWLEGSPHLEETLYWLNLLIDTELPIVGNAAQRPHGQLSSDGDRNIVDAVVYISSEKCRGLGAVAVLDQVVYAARELKKGDDRPGGYKTTGGHGGILGTVKSGEVTIWYRPNYKHTSVSEVNTTNLPNELVFRDNAHDSGISSPIKIKSEDGSLAGECIPRVQIVKYAHYSQEDETENPDNEVVIMAWIKRARSDQENPDSRKPKLHGLVLEGTSPYARGSIAQMKALRIAALSGIPVVRVGRSDPAGRVVTDKTDLFIEGSNLDANKARLLLMASMLKLGRLPKAKDPRNPTASELQTVTDKANEFQKIFESH
ncbi:MAG: asparaginase domain-containing protein [Nitrososphaerales archaeon]